MAGVAGFERRFGPELLRTGPVRTPGEVVWLVRSRRRFPGQSRLIKVPCVVGWGESKSEKWVFLVHIKAAVGPEVAAKRGGWLGGG